MSDGGKSVELLVNSYSDFMARMFYDILVAFSFIDYSNQQAPDGRILTTWVFLD